MTAPFGRRRAVVAHARKVGAYVLLGLVDQSGVPARAGQFYMLAAATGWGAGADDRPWLPRAFSVMGEADGRLWFLLEDVGPGTHRLAKLQKGEAVWITGPLGNGFTAPQDARRPVLCGGGVGVPPLVFWANTLTAATEGTVPTVHQETEGTVPTVHRETGGTVPRVHRETGGTVPTVHQETGGTVPAVPPVALLLGFRGRRHAEVAASMQGVRIATDDGSVGHHGFVTELLIDELDRDAHATVYACGPPGMLEAIRSLCLERGVPAQLALEAGMACGFGACFGCVVPLAGGGYARVCVDGPVLEATAVAEVPAHG